MVLRSAHRLWQARAIPGLRFTSTTAYPRVGVAVAVFRNGQHGTPGRMLASEAKSWEVLLIQRGKEPAKGLWSLPGGSLELGMCRHMVVDGTENADWCCST